jgi:hypothetical protein
MFGNFLFFLIYFFDIESSDFNYLFHRLMWKLPPMLYIYIYIYSVLKSGTIDPESISIDVDFEHLKL